MSVAVVSSEQHGALIDGKPMTQVTELELRRAIVSLLETNAYTARRFEELCRRMGVDG